MKTSLNCSRWRDAIFLEACGTVEANEAARVESHLAACADCRRYAEELRAASAGLRGLATRQVEPSPGFRARWTRAVEEATRPSGVGETATALATLWRGLLLRNLRPALAVASLWILALLFRLSAPEVAPSTHIATARSPVEIYQALETGERLLAGQLERESPVRNTPQRPRSFHPRSEGRLLSPIARGLERRHIAGLRTPNGLIRQCAGAPALPV